MTFDDRTPGGDPPAFSAPWQAQAFALTLALHERGLIDWADWTGHLASAIATAQAAGDPDRGDTYYHHWLSALESLAVAQGWTDDPTLRALSTAWAEAAAQTPHGQPVVLDETRRRRALGGLGGRDGRADPPP